MIVEVHNTHGERHLYTLRRRGRRSRTFVASMDKDFYVSPFIDMARRYTVRVRDEPSASGSRSTSDQDGELLLHTSLDLERRPPDRSRARRMLLRHPFVTHKTTGDDPLARPAAVAARRPLPPPPRGRPMTAPNVADRFAAPRRSVAHAARLARCAWPPRRGSGRAA